MSLCRGLQVAVRQQLGVIRQPVVIPPAHHVRRLSTFPLTARIQQHLSVPCNTAFPHRNYWWSSKPTTPELTAAPLPETTSPSSPNVQPEVSLSPQSLSENFSDDSVSTLSPGGESSLTDPEISVVPDLSSINIPPPPLQLGDLKALGFSNLTPVGAIQAALEFVQVTTGLPWWGTIVTITVLIRLIVLPFTIKQTRAASAMAPVRPKMDALMNEVKEARIAGDSVRAQLAALKVRQLQKDTGTGMGALLSGPVIQAGTSIAAFFAIKKLCDFPLAQLKYESLAWIPSLANADPYYLLPAMSVAIMNLQIYLARADMASSGKNGMHISNVFPLLSILSLPILAYMPAGLVVYLVTNVVLMAFQGAILRIAAVRRSLGIPPLVRPKPEDFPTIKETFAAAKQWFANKEKQALVHAEKRGQMPSFPAQSASRTPLRRRKKD
ncbi:hypothetical protein K439DRAFT_1420512 [Ramaria rubella]|nr:hypothetical protein K439DRAFT_1420512 [Ramaria rubella]